MPALIYGPDAFVVGADTNLDTYNPSWVNVANLSAAGPQKLSVRTATNDVRQAVNFGYATHRWTGVTIMDQRLIGSINTAGSCTLMIRLDANGNGYRANWDVAVGIQVYRITNNGATNTQLGSAVGTVSAATTYTGAFIKALGNGATVALSFGDDANGVFTYSDTDSARYLTGAPGMSIYSNVANTGFLDLMAVWNEAPIPYPVPITPQHQTIIAL